MALNTVNGRGQCASCNAWNTLSQINLGNSISTSPATKADFRKQGYSGDKSNVQNLSDIDLEALPRFSSSIDEMDRVLGGGLVPGSAILIGGNPGAGKSYAVTTNNVPVSKYRKASPVCHWRGILATGWHACKAFESTPEEFKDAGRD